MNKLKPFQKFLILIISVVLALSMTIFGLKVTRPSSLVETVTYDTFTFIKNRLLKDPVEFVISTINDYSALIDTYKENQILKSELDKYMVIINQYNEVNRELQELKELMKIENTLSKFDIKYATISNRSIDGWNNFITIDMGEKDGVKVNQAVMTNKGLIGKVYKVYDNNAVVKLLTAQDGLNKVSIKIIVDDQTTVDGILETYDVESGMYVINLIENTDLVKEGMKIVTSGRGGVFPSGLDVGEVKEVIKQTAKLQITIKAKTSADFTGFNHVAVIERKVGE